MTVTGVSKSRRRGCWLIVLALVGLLILVYMLMPGGGPSPEHDSSMARVMCQEFVKWRLKAPSTAEFPRGEQTATALSRDGYYRVTGAVDAENAFGARLRNRYVCEAHYAGAGEWVLDKLELRE